jgi:hypothetical protein
MMFDFLNLYGPADASLIVIILEDTALRIDNICRLPIGSQCSLLYFAFDDRLSDTCQASLEASSLSAVVYPERSPASTMYLRLTTHRPLPNELGGCQEDHSGL